MKYNVYSIRDKVAEAGGYPFCSRNHGTAARIYRDFIQKNNNSISPEDFELILLGTWDEDRCCLTSTGLCEKIEVALPPSAGKE